MSQLEQLQKAMAFLKSHLPGAAELTEEHTLMLGVDRVADPVSELATNIDADCPIRERNQIALDEFLRRCANFELSKIEIGRLYERYIGYTYEQEGWKVTFKGILDGLQDLGRDLICEKGNNIEIVQAKCWSRRKTIHVKHIYQLHSSMRHYRYQLRHAYREAGHTRRETSEYMKSLDIKTVLCCTTELSDEALDVAKYEKVDVREIALDKDYPMIKCNINLSTNERIYYLPFDHHYDQVIIGNVDGEFYAKTINEAEDKGFRPSHFPD